MDSFIEQDIRRLLSLWRGGIKFKNGENGIKQIEMVKKYRIKVGEDEEVIVISRLITIMEKYKFLTVVGNEEEIELKATVKPHSISEFESFCYSLKELEERKEVESVAS